MNRKVTLLSAALAIFLGTTTAQEEELNSKCYRFFFQDEDFTALEVRDFSGDADLKCERLKNFLLTNQREPIPVYLKPGQGVSTTIPHKNKAIDLYYLRPIDGIEAPLVHETTHILVDSPHPILREGLATAMEERFGTLKTHPTYGISLNEWMYALECADRRIPLSVLESMDWRGGPWETNLVAYVESGSFLSFLIDTYGIEEIVRTLKWTQRAGQVALGRICEIRFQRRLKELEETWIDHISGSRGRTYLSVQLCTALREGKAKDVLRKALRK